MSPIQVFLVALAVIAVIALIAWQAKVQAERERRRRAALAAFAQQNGMRFSEGDPWNLDGRYRGVGDIGNGHDRYAFDVLRLDQPPLTAFQYHYKTWETRTVRRGDRTVTERYEKDHWRKYLILETGAQFPSFVMRPEGLFDKLAGFVGFDDIDFESEEFSKRYFVKSANKEFAYALIHPQMMEFLMNLGFAMQLETGLLILDLTPYDFDAPGVREAIARVAGFVNRIPDFVWQDYAGRVPLKLQEPQYTPLPEPANA
jgi:hypothetical protein